MTRSMRHIQMLTHSSFYMPKYCVNAASGLSQSSHWYLRPSSNMVGPGVLEGMLGSPLRNSPVHSFLTQGWCPMCGGPCESPRHKQVDGGLAMNVVWYSSAMVRLAFAGRTSGSALGSSTGWRTPWHWPSSYPYSMSLLGLLHGHRTM